MQLSTTVHAAAQWSRQAAARRKVLLASLAGTSTNQQLMEIAQRARAAGLPYDTWRRVFHYPNVGW